MQKCADAGNSGHVVLEGFISRVFLCADLARRDMVRASKTSIF